MFCDANSTAIVSCLSVVAVAAAVFQHQLSLVVHVGPIFCHVLSHVLLLSFSVLVVPSSAVMMWIGVTVAVR